MAAYIYSNFDFPNKETALEEIEVIVEIMQCGAQRKQWLNNVAAGCQDTIPLLWTGKKHYHQN